MSTVLGLDLSLTSTGLAVIVDGKFAETHNVKSAGKKGDGYDEFLPRITGLAFDIDIWVYHVWDDISFPDLAVIEAPSHGSKFGNPHERAGLWWKVYEALTIRDIPVATIAPATRAMYITGNGRAKKPEVLAAARELYPDAEIPNDDIADACGLAAMGSRALGQPVESRDLLPKQTKAIEGVKTWPWLRAAA